MLAGGCRDSAFDQYSDPERVRLMATHMLGLTLERTTCGLDLGRSSQQVLLKTR
jgi:hypothetical protein